MTKPPFPPSAYDKPRMLGIHAPGLSLLSSANTRRVYFAFHYQRDIFRLQQIRYHDMTKDDVVYIDGSLEEKAITTGENAVKRMIDEKMDGCSTLCVLIGHLTWQRDWVRYEIFRACERRMGIFGVRVHAMKTPHSYGDQPGINPFSCVGYRVDAARQHYQPIEGALLMADAKRAKPIPFGHALPHFIGGHLLNDYKKFSLDYLPVYDWVAQDGYRHFKGWVDSAASAAGR